MRDFNHGEHSLKTPCSPIKKYNNIKTHVHQKLLQNVVNIL